MSQPSLELVGYIFSFKVFTITSILPEFVTGLYTFAGLLQRSKGELLYLHYLESYAVNVIFPNENLTAYRIVVPIFCLLQTFRHNHYSIFYETVYYRE